MLANAMALDPFFNNKRILLLDKDPKERNDRTWCFWEKTAGPLEALICQKWSVIGVSEQKQMTTTPIDPYQYKMLEGHRFYEAMKANIAKASHCEFQLATVQEIQTFEPQRKGARLHNTRPSLPKQFIEKGYTKVTTSNGVFVAGEVFNSIFNYKPLLAQDKYPVLQQHFIGWFVQTENPIFRPEVATFMDFTVPQKGNTRFMYVLPTDPHKALVEYTLFSKDLLEKQEYEEAIEEYLLELGSGSYEIRSTEKGSIPMSCYPFEQYNTQSLLHIGTAGGWSKPSTGFTFSNTQKKVPALINHLKKGTPINRFPSRDRFWWYDHILLEVLHNDNSQGKAIFEALFKRRSAQLILKFLSQETHFLEELYIMSAANKWKFTKAFFRTLFRR